MLLGVVLFTSCKKEEPMASPSGWEYGAAPLGSCKIFAIEEIKFKYTELKYQVINDSIVVYTDGVDTLHYFIMDSTVEKFTDLGGDSTFKIHRYISDSLGKWERTPDSVWTEKYHRNQFLRTENNITFAKLSFPLTLNTEWDLNAHNSLPKDLIKYTELRGTFEINDSIYTSVLEVEHENIDDDPNDLLPQDLIDTRFEYYVPRIGLIFKESRQYTNGQTNGEFWHNWLFIISEGRYRKETLIKYSE